MKPRNAAIVLVALALFAPAPAAAKTDDIPPGYRAMSLELPAHEWQYLTNGGRVDFLVSFDALLKTGKERVVATILQNVLVKKVMPPRAQGEAGTAQLYLNPNEAAYFALSTNGTNKIAVIERGSKDMAMVPMEMSALKKIVGRRAHAAAPPQTPEGLIPEGERALAVPLPAKTLQDLKKGSRMDVFAASPDRRFLVAEGALVLDVRPPTSTVPTGTAWLTTSGRVSQDLALAVFEGLELEFKPVQGAP
jgi:hypothetical protein